MRLLFITQKVDKNDAVLGFVHNWIKKLSENISEIKVICLEKGEYDLPENVKVLSLGKEEGKSKIKYISRFFKYIFNEEYDSVFVHMNQEYVLLGFWFWKLKHKKVALWYNHTLGGVLTKIAMKLVDFVFHTSPYAYTAHSKRSMRMPAGIDTNQFSVLNSQFKKQNSILYIGRLDKVKHVDLLILAAEILKNKGLHFSVDIYGKASKGSEWYEESLKLRTQNSELENHVTFHDPVPNFETPAIYSTHTVLVNMTPKGNYDKTVLEALACESLVVASSEAFKDFLPEELTFKENDVEDFAKVLEHAITLQDGDRWIHTNKLRTYVVENESLDMLIRKLTETLG